MKNIYIVICAILLSSCQKSFEDCVLENMKGTGSDGAAIQIRKACIEKYGEPAYVTREKYKTLPAGEAEPAVASEPAPEPGPVLKPLTDVTSKEYEIIGHEDADGNSLPFKDEEKLK